MSRNSEWNKAHPDVIRACRARYNHSEKGKESNRRKSARNYKWLQVVMREQGLTYGQVCALPSADRKELLDAVKRKEAA